MELAADIVGALILTYLVSRAFLWLLRGIEGSTRLVIAHPASWTLITVSVFFIEGYSVGAGIIYLLPQIFWFMIDRLRLTNPAAA